MIRGRLSRYMLPAMLVLVLFMLTGVFSALAQSLDLNLRASKIGKKSITLRWDPVEPGQRYYVLYKRARSRSAEYMTAGDTFGNSYTITGLERGATYKFRVDGYLSSGTTTASTINGLGKTTRSNTYRPTCPHLPASVVVTGYHRNTQCQVVDNAGVGQMDVIKRGVLGAVDIWNLVTSLVEVCIRGDGWMVLLDADYAPRMAMELAHYHRGGMTCSIIDRIGTVVLLANGPGPHLPATQPAAQPEQEKLPTFDAVPLTDCQIKLAQTLHLRATPGGEIIGLVWLNSEVPAFEINGYWYKVEFEGVTGYISRYHRKVLHGNCG